MRGFRTAAAGFTAIAAGATHLVDAGHSLFSLMTGAVAALTFGAVAAALVASEGWRSVPERIALATAPRTKEIFRRIPLSGWGACALDARFLGETQMFPEELAKPSHRAIHPYAD